MSDIFELLYEWRQDSQISELRRRLDTRPAADTRVATDPERNLAAAVIRLLLKKGLITSDELAAEVEAINEEQFAKIGNLTVSEVGAPPPENIDVAEIARLDTSAADPAAEIKLDLK
jgi:hypothetical protein